MNLACSLKDCSSVRAQVFKSIRYHQLSFYLPERAIRDGQMIEKSA